MPSLRDALEAALVEDPDDLAAHCAYADYLQEQGDPRGEFIQVQLALEDPARTIEERRQLQRRERELLAEHEREWLGPLAKKVLGPKAKPRKPREEAWEVRFARGWLDRLVLRRSRSSANINMLNRLRETPELRLLRELILEYDSGLSLLLCYAPSLSNLRILQVGGLAEREEFGDSDHGTAGTVVQYSMTFTGVLSSEEDEEESSRTLGFSDFVAGLPRMEEIRLLASGEDYGLVRLFALPNLHNLRVLQIHNANEFHPLNVLADNPALDNLTHLLLEPQFSLEPLFDLAGVRAVLQSSHLRDLTHLQLRRSDLGDVGCSEIVTSGLLKRLKTLDLRYGEITDAGARILADCPDLARLELLDLEANSMTQWGIAGLRRVLGDKLRTDNQQALEFRLSLDVDEGDSV